MNIYTYIYSYTRADMLLLLGQFVLLLIAAPETVRTSRFYVYSRLSSSYH